MTPKDTKKSKKDATPGKGKKAKIVAPPPPESSEEEDFDLSEACENRQDEEMLEVKAPAKAALKRKADESSDEDESSEEALSAKCKPVKGTGAPKKFKQVEQENSDDDGDSEDDDDSEDEDSDEDDEDSDDDDEDSDEDDEDSDDDDDDEEEVQVLSKVKAKPKTKEDSSDDEDDDDDDDDDDFKEDDSDEDSEESDGKRKKAQKEQKTKKAKVKTFTLYCGGLDKGVDEKGLKKIFSENGIAVSDARKSSRMRFGYVDLKKASDLDSALALNGKKIGDLELKIDRAEGKEDRFIHSEFVTLFCGGLKKSMDKNILKTILHKNGIAVSDARKELGKRFGYVDLENASDLDNALALNGKKIGDLELKIDRAKAKEDPPFTPSEKQVTLFCGGLDKDMNKKELKKIFRENGIAVSRARKSLQMKFGYVDLKNASDLDSALALNGKKIGNLELKIDETEPKFIQVILFCGGLSKNMDAKALKMIFTQNGIVVSDAKKEVGKRYGHVYLKKGRNMKCALALNGTKIGNSKLKIEESVEKAEKAKEDKPLPPKLTHCQKRAASKDHKRKVAEREEKTLFVKNLADSVTEDSLKDFFKGCVSVGFPKKAGSHKGFAYIMFEDAAKVEEVLKEKQGAEFEGRSLFLDYVGQKLYGKHSSGQDKVLFVKNLSFDTDENSMMAAFSGSTAARIPRNKDSGKSKGFGFVQFSTPEAAKAAFTSMKGQKLDGRTICIAFAGEQSKHSGQTGKGGQEGGSGGHKRRGRGRGRGGGHGLGSGDERKTPGDDSKLNFAVS